MIIEHMNNLNHSIVFLTLQSYISKKNYFKEGLLKGCLTNYHKILNKRSDYTSLNETNSWLRIKFLRKITKCHSFWHSCKLSNTCKTFITSKYIFTFKKCDISIPNSEWSIHCVFNQLRN